MRFLACAVLACFFYTAAAYKLNGLLGRTISAALAGRKQASALTSGNTALGMSKDEDLNDAIKDGLEVGLFKAIKNKDSTVKPGDLLKKYGAAYLMTSITLAIISYGICYALVSAGIDVAALLGKVGIEVTGTSSNVGTAGIAYVIHKAASPIRFPPTVALTPVVANIIGKKVEEPAKSSE